MSKHYIIHPDNPQERLLLQVIDVIKSGGVVALPTDCCYVICCRIGDKEAENKISDIREHSDNHRLALLVSDVSMASNYAKIDNKAFRLIRKSVPGAYTFILPANKDLPKRLLDKRKNIGIRIPDNKILLKLLELYGQPLYSSTLWLPNEDFPLFDPDEIQQKMSNTLDCIVDGGYGSNNMTTIVSLVDSNNMQVIREGKGDSSRLL